MLKRQIQIGKVYEAKVSGNVVPVVILRENSRGGWTAENKRTRRLVTIRTAGRLRREITS